MGNGILKVTLWGEEVGKLKWDYNRMRGVFTFHPDFVRKGWNIAPLTASIYSSYGKGESVEGIPMRRQNKFTGLPAFIADSLPDSWGKKLTVAWLQEYGAETRKMTPLDYLAFMGRRAMGALEFEPDKCPWQNDRYLDLDKVFALAAKIFHQRENICLSPEEEWDMAALCSVGTSAGGMQPKAVIAQNVDNGEIRSGQVIHQGNWKYYILKFGGHGQEQQSEMEMAWYRMATDAGIDMMPSSIVNFGGCRHFMTERFDRVNNEKIHLQTLGAMMPEADSYEDIMWICDELHLPYREKEEMYRRMVFNIMAGCTDDHNRNFSFMMDKQGKWHITPAYDLTFTVTVKNGSVEGTEHELTVRGKNDGITENDLLLFAKENDIKQAVRIIKAVKDVVKRAYDYMRAEEVNEKNARQVDEYLNGGLITQVVISQTTARIRCHIDGVQQISKQLSQADGRLVSEAVRDGQNMEAVKDELAQKYFKNEIDCAKLRRDENQGIKR